MAGVALGVGIAVALQGGTQSVLAEFRRTVNEIAGSCQLQLSAGEAGVPEALLERLQDVAEVRAASPVIEAMAETDGGSQLLIIGLDMTGDAQMRPWLFQTGEGALDLDPIVFLAQPDSILMNRAFATRRGWGIGSKLRLRTMAGPKEFTIRGLLAGESLEKIYGGNVAVMDVFGAQRVFGRGTSVDRIDIILSENAALEAARAAIRRVAGPGYALDPPAARGEQFEDLLSAYQTLQALVCLFAVALGICMIDGSFRLAVTQRRMEIGILRSLGATRGQIQSMFIVEGLLTGALGSALGLALGVRFFTLSSRTIEVLFRGSFGGLTEQTHQFQLSPSVVALAFLTGIGISLLAAWLPSRDAAHASPVEALRPMLYQQELKPWRPGALLFSALLGACAFAGGLRAGSSLAFYASMSLLVIAVILAMPTFLLIIVRPLRPLFSRAIGWEAALALDTLARTPRRAVTTMIVLSLVFAQAVMVAGVSRSFRQTLDSWVEAAFQSDLLLSASSNLTSQSLRFPPGFEDTLRKIPGVASVQPLRSVHLPFRGRPVMAIATDYSLSAAKKGQRAVAGNWRDMCLKTAAGQGLFISESLALRERLENGSQVELNAPSGIVRLPVVGIVSDHSDKRGVLFLSLDLYRRFWNDQTTDKFRIDIAPGATVNETRIRLRESLGDRYPASLMTKAEARDFVLRPKGRKLTPLEIQLLICLGVAALALMNMASISVAERSREFAVLRAIGGYRRQVRKTLLIETLTTGGISLALGLAVGAVLLAYLLVAIQRYVTGVHMEYAFPWDSAPWLVCVAAAAGPAAVLAALPAMTRIPVSSALDAE